MPIVVNATKEEITIKIVGSYFKFAPEKSKTMGKDIASWIQTNPGAKGCGLAVIPDLYQDGEEIDEVSSADMNARKAAQEELRTQAIESALQEYLDKHRRLIYNNQVSMRQDLGKANIQADPAVFASKGELDAMRLVARYDSKGQDAEQSKIDEVNKLMGAVKGKEK